MSIANNTTESRSCGPESSHATPSSSAAGCSALSGQGDADLLEAWCRDRQSAALAALVDRYSVMVLSVCRRRCRSEADAEDAYQSTFLYLARSGSKIRHPERLVGWLHRVAQRAAVATQKSTKRKTEPMLDPPTMPDDPLDQLTQRHEAIVLDEELAELPEHYRAAIVMHLYEGHPLQSLADHFGTTVGSIRGRLQRGKQLLARRLRHRGVVPVFAFAAANAWTVSAAQATQAASSFADSTLSGDLPDPPIQTDLLDSLLARGTRLMPSLSTTAGVLLGSTLIALVMINSGSSGQHLNDNAPLSLPLADSASVQAQFRSNIDGSSATDPASAMANPESSATTPPQSNLEWTQQPVVPTPTSRLAATILAALDEQIDLQFSVSLDGLTTVLSESLGMPVLLDERSVAFAKLDRKNVTVQYDGTSVPLRTALRRILQPLGLKAIVEDEGLVVMADPSELVHRGIGTSHWINVDEQAAVQIAETLEREIEVDVVELPLRDALAQITDQFKLPILVDRRSLEELGMSDEEIVSLCAHGIKLRNALKLMLRDLELIYSIDGQTLVVTTEEAAESRLLNRIYWLEGTGLAKGDSQSVIETIQTAIQPDAWEQLGGPSTIIGLSSPRPAIMVSTTYPIHEEIERLFQTLRQSYFGQDPVLEKFQVPTSQSSPGGFGGGGGFF